MTDKPAPDPATARSDEELDELVELRVLVRREQRDWLATLPGTDGPDAVERELRVILDEARQERELFVAARARAVGYAQVAAECAAEYLRVVGDGASDTLGGELALDLSFCERRCHDARGRVDQLKVDQRLPGSPTDWPPLPTEADPHLADLVGETVLQVAVDEVRAVRAERRQREDVAGAG